MNKFSRMVDVLDLFSSQVTLLTAEDIARLLQVSRPTAFRYARELTAAGFLANYSGSYSLGARIITLDHRIRESDPLLRIAQPVMQELTSEMVATTAMCRMYNDEIVNVHQEDVGEGAPRLGQGLGRGRSIPLFRGAAGKAMLANLPKARVHRVYKRYATHPDVLALGESWEAFWSVMKEIHARGFYISVGEVNERTVGIAVPISLRNVGAVAVLAMIFPAERLSIFNSDGLGQKLNAAARGIASRLEELTTVAEPEGAA